MASIAFSLAAFEMMILYGIVHFEIMLDKKAYPDPASLSAVFKVLDQLHLLRLIFPGLALVWALCAFRGRPRWPALVALCLALVALLQAFVMM